MRLGDIKISIKVRIMRMKSFHLLCTDVNGKDVNLAYVLYAIRKHKVMLFICRLTRMD